VLREAESKLEAGEKVALIGVSGSGKSTIAKLDRQIVRREPGSRAH